MVSFLTRNELDETKSLEIEDIFLKSLEKTYQKIYSNSNRSFLSISMSVEENHLFNLQNFDSNDNLYYLELSLSELNAIQNIIFNATAYIEDNVFNITCKFERCTKYLETFSKIYSNAIMLGINLEKISQKYLKRFFTLEILEGNVDKNLISEIDVDFGIFQNKIAKKKLYSNILKCTLISEVSIIASNSFNKYKHKIYADIGVYILEDVGGIFSYTLTHNKELDLTIIEFISNKKDNIFNAYYIYETNIDKISYRQYNMKLLSEYEIKNLISENLEYKKYFRIEKVEDKKIYIQCIKNDIYLEDYKEEIKSLFGDKVMFNA